MVYFLFELWIKACILLTSREGPAVDICGTPPSFFVVDGII